ncbi:MAG: S8 family serine peptidase [Bdellovibrionales bacterium]
MMKTTILVLLAMFTFTAGADEFLVRAPMAFTASSGIPVVKSYPLTGIQLIDVSSEEADRLRDRGFELERNQNIYLLDRGPATTYESSDWHLETIHAPAANALPNGKGEGITICVVDTGVDSSHPALIHTVIGGRNFSGEGEAEDFSDGFGHGTGIAGLIGGSSGVASGAKIYVAKVMSSTGSGTLIAAAEGILDCIGRSQVINLSFGMFEDSKIIRDVIDEAIRNGLTVVAAAGNDPADLGFPARYAPVVAVGAVTRELKIPTFSARGESLDFVAPGEKVRVLMPGGGQAVHSGSSFSAALVSGVEAIRLSRGTPQLRALDLGFDPLEQGQGLINAYLSAQ